MKKKTVIHAKPSFLKWVGSRILYQHLYFDIIYNEAMSIHNSSKTTQYLKKKQYFLSLLQQDPKVSCPCVYICFCDILLKSGFLES